MASTSKEEKPTAPLLPAVQPAPLSTAVQFAAVQEVNKLDIAERHQQTRREWVRIVRRWICIISIQISAPGIVYYTYFYLFCIIPYFLLWNPGPRQPASERPRAGRRRPPRAVTAPVRTLQVVGLVGSESAL